VEAKAAKSAAALADEWDESTSAEFDKAVIAEASRPPQVQMPNCSALCHNKECVGLPCVTPVAMPCYALLCNMAS
jgi:hypothetical protein